MTFVEFSKAGWRINWNELRSKESVFDDCVVSTRILVVCRGKYFPRVFLYGQDDAREGEWYYRYGLCGNRLYKFYFEYITVTKDKLILPHVNAMDYRLIEDHTDDVIRWMKSGELIYHPCYHHTTNFSG